MPCTDGGPSYDNVRQFDPQAVEAMLCAIVTRLHECGNLDSTVNAVDWREAGVNEGVFWNWWNQHHRKDEERRERERQEQAMRDVRARAVAKLTPEERQTLGL